MIYFAHSENQRGKRHPLPEHLACVGRMAEEFAGDARWSSEARLAGLLPDLGKYGDLFQRRLEGKEKGLDHWSAGAWVALKQKCAAAALAVQGHHIGLQHLDGPALRRLKPDLLASRHPLQLRLTAPHATILESRLAADDLTPPQVAHPMLGRSLAATIPTMLDVRMLFSSLVDADYLDTEAHFDAHLNEAVTNAEAPGWQPHEIVPDPGSLFTPIKGWS